MNTPNNLHDPYNGYEYVDLGLPSGLLWATCNVGANKPEDAGMYFAWGETTGYTGEQVTAGVREFDDATYHAGSAASISADLTLEQDAAHVNMGGNWRMPTKAEFDELKANCTTTWTTDYNGTGVKGRVFTGPNGNYVFFPAAGYCWYSLVEKFGSEGCYWSASWDSEYNACYLFFNSGVQDLWNGGRYYGYLVRGVSE